MTPLVVGATICVVLMAVVIWDAYLYADSKPDNSISQVIINLSRKYPLIPFGIGFVMGGLALHWFDVCPQC